VIETSSALLDVLRSMKRNERSTITFRRAEGIERRTFAECYQEAERLAHALQSGGVESGEIVAIHGETSYGWLLADLACVLCGAVSLALYPGAPLERVVGAALEARVKRAFVERADAAKAFRRVGIDVVLLGAGNGFELGIDDLLARGGRGRFEVSATRPAAVTIVSTSGTLSEPKLFAARAEPLLYTMQRFRELYEFRADERLLVGLPLAHLPQRMMTYGCLELGFDLVLSEPRLLVHDSNEFAPTVHVTVPRLLGHLWERVIRGAGTSKAAFGPAARCVFVGSAPTPPALLEQLHQAGTPLYEVYGTTELGMVCLNVPGHRRFGSVGRPAPWLDVKLEPGSGEVMVRTPTPFLYARVVDGEVQVADVDAEAYAETGDVGSFDAEGYLTLLGRAKDFLALSTGEKVCVRPVEEAVMTATGAALCVLSGNGEKQISALLFFEEGHGAAADVLVERCRDRLREVNQKLHPWERVRAFGLVQKGPSVADGTLTETLKPRRHRIMDLYGSMREQWKVGTA